MPEPQDSQRDDANPIFPGFAARTLVIIPAHNEEECVGSVVVRLKQRGFPHVRVVDNASTDATARLAREAGAEVLSIAGRGYGLACWEGTLELPEGIEWLLFCNADASDDFEAYDRFAGLADDHDLILGTRTHPGDRRAMTLPQRLGNWLAPFLIGLLWGHRFTDLGPQRAIRVDAFRQLNMHDRGFGWTLEMQVRAVEENLRISEIPVRTFPRPAGQSKISGNLRGSIAAGWVILTTLARLKWRGASGAPASRRHLEDCGQRPEIKGCRPEAGAPSAPRQIKGSRRDAGAPDAPGFAATLRRHGLDLRRGRTEILQVNTGKLCNLTCVHCHVNAGPKRKEIITRETIDRIVDWLAATAIHTVDLTGGAPEMVPDFRHFVKRLRGVPGVRTIIDRCNLTILNEPGYEDMAGFLADHRVSIVASMPCYCPENVNAQRGEGVFDSSILALQKLNALGFGRDETLRLDLVYNPNGDKLPPPQATLESDYKRELKTHFGIDFHRLYCITNMPISRFRSWLKNNGKLEGYMNLLREHFNPAAVEGVMCRNTLSVGWQGELYDCDFNQQLGMQWKNGKPLFLWDLDASSLEGRPIALGDHCFGCTAGCGSSCQGTLT